MTNHQTNGSRPPLRIGLLTDSLLKPRWVQQLIRDICASPAADIVLVIEYGQPPANQHGLIPTIWQQRNYWLYKAYSRLDNLIFSVEPDAFKKVNLEPLISECPLLGLEPVRKKYSDYFRSEDVAAVAEHHLDVLLYFGRRILRGEILHSARYGVWSYHHGDNLVNRGGPPGFWEVMDGQPVTGSVLQVLTESLDGGQIIYRSYAPTHKRSVKRNKNHYYWKSVAFVRRKLEDLYERGTETLQDDPYACIFQPYSQRLYQNPTNREFLPTLLKFGWRTAVDKLQELATFKQWFLAYQLKPSGGATAPALYQFKLMMPPWDRDWADPFPVEHNDKYFIFIEEYLYREKKGHIAVIEMDRQGHYSPPVKVLEKPDHLSYPFIFRWQNEIYMIPETARSRQVELYRCRSFPGEWQLETVLLDNVRAVDATLAEIEGRWWMFVNIGQAGTTHNHDELHLFYADTPLGPWQSHRRNPIKSDARSARPAGNLFWWRGELYRPVQDCSERYGYAIVLNKINCLNPDRYEETEVSKILPHWSKQVIANHTFNRAAGLTVIDGMVENPKTWIEYQNIRFRFRKDFQKCPRKCIKDH